MSTNDLINQLQGLSEKVSEGATQQNQSIQEAITRLQEMAMQGHMNDVSPFIMGLTIFVLAVFVGYYVVWRVTPALHSPLMAVTNAISSVIIVGALVAAGATQSVTAQWFGFIAVTLAAINIFGGFVVTQRMLQMFKKKG